MSLTSSTSVYSLFDLSTLSPRNCQTIPFLASYHHHSLTEQQIPGYTRNEIKLEFLFAFVIAWTKRQAPPSFSCLIPPPLEVYIRYIPFISHSKYIDQRSSTLIHISLLRITETKNNKTLSTPPTAPPLSSKNPKTEKKKNEPFEPDAAYGSCLSSVENTSCNQNEDVPYRKPWW